MRTIKILPLILAVVSITIVAKAQDINTCRPKAEHILTAAQSHKLDGIDELLAPDFRFSNIKQPVAAKVLKQIITQMPASSYKIEKKDKNTSVLYILDHEAFWGVSNYLVIQTK